MKFVILVSLIIFSFLFIQVHSQRVLDLSRLGNNCTHETVRRFCGDELICLNGKCSYCTNDTDCQLYNGVNQCRQAVDMNNNPVRVCLHKSLFPYIDVWDVLSSILCFIGGVFGNAGGTGGGGIFVPVLTVVGRFSAPLAIPLSKALIVGSSICNLLMLVPLRHPRADKPLINYDVVMIFEPIVLLGTILGVLCNIMFPTWLIVLLLVIVLSITSVRTTMKGIKQFKEDLKQRNETTASLLSEEEKQKAVVGYDQVPSEENEEIDEKIERQQRNLTALMRIESLTPYLKILVVCFCWLVIFILSILRGGQGSPSIIGVKPCSAVYWILLTLAFPIVGAVCVIICVYLVTTHQYKVRHKYPFIKGDIQWTKKNTILYPLIAGFGGFLAGLLGIGGGMVTGPLLLELDVDPQVAAASNIFMIVFTSAITASQYFILGRLPLDYGIWYALNGFVSAFIGQLALDYFVNKYKMTSFIIISLAIAVSVSTILMFGVGVQTVIEDFRTGAYMGFNLPC